MLSILTRIVAPPAAVVAGVCNQRCSIVNTNCAVLHVRETCSPCKKIN